ncbi:MAG: IclR family transcriptional regulator [Candidatus Limivicinus sp.]
MDGKEDIKVKSLEKAILVIECFLSGSELGVTEISDKLGYCKSTVFNILSTFRAMGYLEKNPETEKYRLGVRFCDFSRAVGENFSIKKISAPYMQELANQVNERVYLGVPLKDEVLYLESMYPVDEPAMMKSLMGYRAKMYCTGLGKAMMAFLPEQDIDAALAEPLEAFTENTITDPKLLRQNLMGVRSCGYAIDNMEHEFGVKCVAMPVFGRGHSLAGAVSISGPSLRFSKERIESMLVYLKVCTEKIQNRLP